MDLYSSSDEWVSAYLDWIDSEMADDVIKVQTVVVERRRRDRRFNGPDASRETALLMALRAESDCVKLLRQALQASGATHAH